MHRELPLPGVLKVQILLPPAESLVRVGVKCCAQIEDAEAADAGDGRF